MSSRADRNNNPAAFTTDVARLALTLNVDYVDGDPFLPPSKLATAKLIGDPIAVTIKLIDKIGYETKSGFPRWAYINIPKFVWDSLSYELKKQVIGVHYFHEGGTELKHLFE